MADNEKDYSEIKLHSSKVTNNEPIMAAWKILYLEFYSFKLQEKDRKENQLDQMNNNIFCKHLNWKLKKKN